MSLDKDVDEVVKLVVYGRRKAGKSSFCQKFSTGEYFVPKVARVGLGMVFKKVNKRGKVHSIELWDFTSCTLTSREAPMANQLRTILHGAKGVLWLVDLGRALLPDLDHTQLRDDHGKIAALFGTLPVLMVFTKCEVIGGSEDAGVRRRCWDFIASSVLRGAPFCFCSARHGHGVHASIAMLLSMMAEGGESSPDLRIGKGPSQPSHIFHLLCNFSRLEGFFTWLQAINSAGKSGCTSVVDCGNSIAGLASYFKLQCMAQIYSSLRCQSCIDSLPLPPGMQAAVASFGYHFPVICSLLENCPRLGLLVDSNHQCTVCDPPAVPSPQPVSPSVSLTHIQRDSQRNDAILDGYREDQTSVMSLLSDGRMESSTPKWRKFLCCASVDSVG